MKCLIKRNNSEIASDFNFIFHFFLKNLSMALVQISQMSYINTLINKINIYSTLCVCVCMHMCNLKGEQYTTKHEANKTVCV